jgi:hypothetical protein
VPELRKRASKSSKFSSGEGPDGVVMREWDSLRKEARRSSRVILCGVGTSAGWGWEWGGTGGGVDDERSRASIRASTCTDVASACAESSLSDVNLVVLRVGIRESESAGESKSSGDCGGEGATTRASTRRLASAHAQARHSARVMFCVGAGADWELEGPTALKAGRMSCASDDGGTVCSGGGRFDAEGN